MKHNLLEKRYHGSNTENLNGFSSRLTKIKKCVLVMCTLGCVAASGSASAGMIVDDSISTPSDIYTESYAKKVKSVKSEKIKSVKKVKSVKSEKIKSVKKVKSVKSEKIKSVKKVKSVKSEKVKSVKKVKNVLAIDKDFFGPDYLLLDIGKPIPGALVASGDTGSGKDCLTDCDPTTVSEPSSLVLLGFGLLGLGFIRRRAKA